MLQFPPDTLQCNMTSRQILVALSVTYHFIQAMLPDVLCAGDDDGAVLYIQQLVSSCLVLELVEKERMQAHSSLPWQQCSYYQTCKVRMKKEKKIQKSMFRHGISPSSPRCQAGAVSLKRKQACSSNVWGVICML